MSNNRNKIVDRISALNSALNDEHRINEVAKTLDNFKTSAAYKFRDTDELKAGFETLASTMADLVPKVASSIPKELDTLGIVQLDASAATKLTKIAQAVNKTDMEAIAGKLELATDGFLDVVIASPLPEALGAAMKDVLPEIKKVDIRSIMEQNIDTMEHADESIASVVDNLYGTKKSKNVVLNNLVQTIDKTSKAVLNNTNKGFGSNIENIVEETYRSAENKLYPVLYKNNVANNLTSGELTKVVELKEKGQALKAARFLQKFSDTAVPELIKIVESIDNKASKNIEDRSVNVDINAERTDTLTNIWREADSPVDGRLFKPVIGSEITTEIINMDREVTQVIVVFLEGVNATVEEYHELYVNRYNTGINQHFYIGYDGIAYRGRPLEKESLQTRKITNNHYKRSILIGINVDEHAEIHKTTPEQVAQLVSLLQQIMHAKPGIQIFSEKDVGWYYQTNADAIDIPSLIKTKLNKVNSSKYNPLIRDPLTQEELANLVG
tara:strand:- start:5785 stop:7278 length:1494 start_codon:yes stop_codon:yes gene_type:complete